eukprot:GHVT01044518.1.p2 GENE.GHVT01044518.1~~GHVT01044518.1.p2  ORF type:complete len:121 (-),score=17.42 GHVT01044518.1:1931-2293(-)
MRGVRAVGAPRCGARGTGERCEGGLETRRRGGRERQRNSGRGWSWKGGRAGAARREEELEEDEAGDEKQAPDENEGGWTGTERRRQRLKRGEDALKMSEEAFWVDPPPNTHRNGQIPKMI